ncbi:MAG: mannose-1-phosphate guanylyltransferase [Epsilonproteobacteria bacterium]|nr:mannose-1-phosphate guanylyltransferase [Campylobacterota bacterium]
MRNVYVVILAGGSGQRLWPLSTPDHPKQVLPFIGKKSLLQLTYERVQKLVCDQEKIIVVTRQDQKELILNELPRPFQGHIICEPVGKNTAPAIYLANDFIARHDPHALVVVVPADHFIPDTNDFCKTLYDALAYVDGHDDLALVGIRPRNAATGYGYIQTGSVVSGVAPLCLRVEQFHEKPVQKKAEEYVSMQNMWWNSGMVVGRVHAFLNEFRACASQLFTELTAFVQGQYNYQDVQSISFDYAVLEASSRVVLFPATFEWCDVGNVYTFLLLKQQYDKKHDVVSINGRANVTNVIDKKVVCIGVSDMCIIETDDVVVVVPKQDVESVKQAAQKVFTVGV